MPEKNGRRTVTALRVHQWLNSWETVRFSDETHRARPKPYFYIFALPAPELRSLCGIARRDANNIRPRTADLGIQRQHEPERSEEISRFVEYGFPWSTLSVPQRKSGEYSAFQKPGWLPTAIVINILEKSDVRDGKTVSPQDLVKLEDKEGQHSLSLPYSKWTKKWNPAAAAPFEVIDGQHRLWAFENREDYSAFEVPVVAFHGLDISWQAYLFWTINIKPKRINPSLAFDLYPLLREEDWLDSTEHHPIYRDTRSQELVEAIWAFPESPWYDKINMLGEKKIQWVSQSAWIRSLSATLVRPWDRKRSKAGGLFGSRLGQDGEVLGWSRAQQAAFLIYIWVALRDAIEKQGSSWAHELRHQIAQQKDIFANPDPAFYSQFSLISTDQGVRGYLHVVNDVLFSLAASLKLNIWPAQNSATAASRPSELATVDEYLASIKHQKFCLVVDKIATRLAHFDWRTSSCPGLTEAQRRAKLVFRGSSGYKEIRTQLFEHLATEKDEIGKVAEKLKGNS